MNEVIRLKQAEDGRSFFTVVPKGMPVEHMQSLEKPLFAHICVTNKCNLNCPYCYAADHNVSHDMTDEQLKQVVEICNNNDIMCITWTGGEPLLRSNFSEIVLQVYKYGIKQTILTNGILLENIIFLLITKSHTDCNMATVVALIKCQCLLKKANFTYYE